MDADIIPISNEPPQEAFDTIFQKFYTDCFAICEQQTDGIYINQNNEHPLHKLIGGDPYEFIRLPLASIGGNNYSFFETKSSIGSFSPDTIALLYNPSNAPVDIQITYMGDTIEEYTIPPNSYIFPYLEKPLPIVGLLLILPHFTLISPIQLECIGVYFDTPWRRALALHPLDLEGGVGIVQSQIVRKETADAQQKQNWKQYLQPRHYVPSTSRERCEERCLLVKEELMYHG